MTREDRLPAFHPKEEQPHDQRVRRKLLRRIGAPAHIREEVKEPDPERHRADIVTNKHRQRRAPQEHDCFLDHVERRSAGFVSRASQSSLVRFAEPRLFPKLGGMKFGRHGKQPPPQLIKGNPGHEHTKGGTGQRPEVRHPDPPPRLPVRLRKPLETRSAEHPVFMLRDAFAAEESLALRAARHSFAPRVMEAALSRKRGNAHWASVVDKGTAATSAPPSTDCACSISGETWRTMRSAFGTRPGARSGARP